MPVHNHTPCELSLPVELELEMERAKDVIRLTSFLLSELAIEENALLEAQPSTESLQEMEAELASRKLETAEALRATFFGSLSSHTAEHDRSGDKEEEQLTTFLQSALRTVPAAYIDTRNATGCMKP